MTDNTTRWTIRLTDEDEQMLDALCQAYGVKRPDAVRRAIREALANAQDKAGARHTITLSGSFVPLSSDSRMTFPVQLRRKAADE
jgi:predicted DNA-binding protein